MAIQLKNTNELFEVLGDFTSENAMTVKSHFEQFLKEADNIILSLENVTFMEPNGALTLEQLYLDFIKSNKVLQIVGKTNTNIREVMNATKTSYILSDDRI